MKSKLYANSLGKKREWRNQKDGTRKAVLPGGKRGNGTTVKRKVRDSGAVGVSKKVNGGSREQKQGAYPSTEKGNRKGRRKGNSSLTANLRKMEQIEGGPEREGGYECARRNQKEE